MKRIVAPPASPGSGHEIGGSPVRAQPPSRLVIVGLSLGLGSCASPNEEITLVFPSEEARAATEAIVVTLLEPLSAREEGPPAFVGCERIGSFSPVNDIPLGPFARTPGVIDRERAEFPFDGTLSLGFDAVPIRDENPWGVVAVTFEARGTAYVPGVEREPEDLREATLLIGCHCARTRTGRFPQVDPELDATVRDRCPLLGGSDGEPTRSRSVPLRAVAPPEFRLEPCGEALAAAPDRGRARPGPAACVRTDVCSDTSSELCFECSLECTELESRRGAAVEIRAVTAEAPVTAPRQIVLTDGFGRATPVFDTIGCDGFFEVEARILGRDDDVVSFRVDCVPGLDDLELWGELSLADRVIAVAAVPASESTPPALAVLSQRNDVESGTPVAELRVFTWEGGLQPAGSPVSIADATAHGVVAFTAGADGRGPVRIVVATTSLEPELEDQRVELRSYRWIGSGFLEDLEDGLGHGCTRCDCGSLARCARDPDCPESEQCGDGRCRSVAPEPCEAPSDCERATTTCFPGGRWCREFRVPCDDVSDCPSGAACVGGICDAQVPCGTVGACPEGTTCFEGSCKAAAPVSCQSRRDCADGSICWDGRCTAAEPCRCALRAAPSEPVVLRARDLDRDGWTDLVVGRPGGRTVVFRPAGGEAGTFPVEACSCARVSPEPSSFDVLQLGGDELTAGRARGFDLAVAASDGAYVRYGETVEPDEERLTCGGAALIGQPFFAVDLRAATTRCGAGASDCGARDDLLVLGVIGGPFDQSASVIRIVYGSDGDPAADPSLFERPEGQSELFISREEGEDEAFGALALETGDFNGDDRLDFAVLVRTPPSVRVFLGSGTGAFTEAGRARYGDVVERCVPSADFAAVDLDRDGHDEVVVVCDPTVSPRALVFGGAP